jgi:hypothetical protein
MLNLPNTLTIAFGMSVGGSPHEMGLVGLLGVRVRHGCGRTLDGPNRPHLRWVNSLDVCDMPHDDMAQS